MDTCCPSGYTYDIVTNQCKTLVAPYVYQGPSQCPCCPPGTYYVDQDGFFDSFTLAGRIQIGNLNISTFVGTCVTIVNNTWAIPTSQSPGACACCPPGYTYNSFIDRCWTGNAATIIATIPCVSCICPTDPPPQECIDCTESHPTISFSFNPDIKNCIDCNSVGEMVGLGGFYDTLLPIQLMDPIINFKLRS